MQMDRRPNRGPYVAALVCLLTLCLTIPFYWQSSAERAKKREAAEYDRLTTTLGGNFVRLDRYPGDRPATARRRSGRYARRVVVPVGEHVRAASRAPSPTCSWNCWARRSRAMTTWPKCRRGSSGSMRRRCCTAPARDWPSLSRASNWYRSWHDAAVSDRAIDRRAEPVPTFSLMLTSPNDRLAMLTPRVTPKCGNTVDAFPTPWCSPAVLIERLAILAAHPYSADWARADDRRSAGARRKPSGRTRTLVAAQLERLQNAHGRGARAGGCDG